MTDVQLFLCTHELSNIILQFAEKRRLAACIGKWKGFDRFDLGRELSGILDSEPNASLFLYPQDQDLPDELTSENVLPRFMGWTQITQGRLLLKDGCRILTMTSIGAENRQGVAYKPATWLRQLKKDVSDVITFGTEGFNVMYGGSTIYNHIGYTVEALRLFHDGALWKQFDTGNVEFAPVGEEPPGYMRLKEAQGPLE